MDSLSKFPLILFFTATTTFSALGQSEIKEEIELILHSNRTYAEITHHVDSIFEANDLGYASINLDGAREKYERWKSFWENFLDESGYIVDFTEYFRKSANPVFKSGGACDSVDIDVEWSNLNYNEHLGYQIDHGRTSAMGFSPSNPNVFYVGAAWGGLWKTEDGGLSYVNVNDRLPLAAVSGIIVDDANEDHLIISLGDILGGGVNSIGIYESFDGGSTFQVTSIDYGLTDNKKIYSLASNYGNQTVLFAATSSGLLRSNDYFATSTLVQTGSMQSVQFSPSNSDIGYATSGSGRLYKTTDTGNTFTLLIDFGSGAARLDVDDSDVNKLVVTCDDQVYYSTDGGVTFIQSTMPEGNSVVNLVPGTTSGIVVGNFDTYRSDDAGVNFYPISHWLGDNGLPIIHVDQRNCFSNPYFPDEVYFCNDGGIFRYNPGGNDFTNLSKDLIITQYYDIAVSDIDSLVLGGGSQDNGNVTRNDDGSWEAYAGTGDGMQQAIHLSDPNIRFWEYQYGGMRRYDALTGDNSDIEPSAQTVDGAWHTPYLLDPNDHNRIICGYQRVYESNDLGDTWNYLGSDFSNGSSLRQLAIANANSDYVYAATNSQMWRKTNLLDWTPITVPAGMSPINDIIVDNNNPDIIYSCSSGYSDGNKVFKSINGGASWENISYNLPNLPTTSLRLLDPQLGAIESGLFVGTIGAVYYLPEGENEWFKFGCLPVTLVNDIEIQYSTNKIFIGTYGRGIFEAPLDNFELVSTNENLSMEEIHVYPNPASDQLFIRSDRQISSIVIYDQFMRKIETIDFQNDHESIDIQHLSRGVYMCVLTDESGAITLKNFVKL